MKITYAVAAALLLVWAVEAKTEIKDEDKLEKKQEDVSDVSTQDVPADDSEEEDIITESIIEHLREITALQDTIKLLLPPKDPHEFEKAAKQPKNVNEQEEDLSEDVQNMWETVGKK